MFLYRAGRREKILTKFRLSGLLKMTCRHKVHQNTFYIIDKLYINILASAYLRQGDAAILPIYDEPIT